MTDNVRPFPKSVQLARGQRRYRRKVASPKQWQAIREQKSGPCRVCAALENPVMVSAEMLDAVCTNKADREDAWLIDPHHIVWREHGGDDVPENIAPVCRPCHDALHNRAEPIARLFLRRLSDAEYAYMVQRGGEDYPARAYGIDYTRGAAVPEERE